MKLAWLAFIFTGIVLALSARLCRAQTSAPAANIPQNTVPVSDRQIADSLRNAVNFLLAAKSNDNWERNPNWESGKAPQNGGETAMALWVLLTLGQNIDDPRLSPNSPDLAPAIQWMLHHEAETVYVAAIQAQVLSLLSTNPEYQRPLQRLKTRLLDSQLDDGGFSYGLAQPVFPDSEKRETPKVITGTWDASNSRYGLLGIFAAADAQNLAQPGLREFWDTSEKFWRAHQNADGGWGYSAKQDESRPALSAAGVASLLLLSSANQHAQAPDAALGMAYVKRNFHIDPGDEQYDYLYSIARAGMAAGLRRFGNTDWYAAGAASLTASQRPDGSWSGPSPIVATSYAALFLTQGVEPLAFNKLQLAEDSPGHLAVTDAANLTLFFRHTFEEPLSWRQVSLQDDSADFSAAPILLMVISTNPHFSDHDLVKLRAFCQAGGIIFSTGPASLPSDVIGQYAQQMAGGLYHFRKLPADHPLFTINGHIAKPPALWGLSNGVRELWIHAPTDLQSSWLKGGGGTGDAWRIPANLLRYVTGGTGWLHSRLSTPSAAPTTQSKDVTIGLAQIMYKGNWNPEPLAWPRMVDIAAKRSHIDLQISTARPEELDARKELVAHLTGTENLEISDDQLAALKAYVTSGGTLFIDAAGSNPSFIESAKALITRMYPDAKLQPMPLNSPIYNGSIPRSVKADRITYRAYTTSMEQGGRSPRLQGVQLNGRYIIIFSAEDITSGLLGDDIWGFAGYSPLSAQSLTRNVILYAATMGPR